MHHDDHGDFDLFDDSFDEKTFQLELQVADSERREAAWRMLVVMQRLARLRAREQNITFDAAWRDIFDVDRLHGEMIGSEQKRSDLAHRVWNSLDHLGELRSERRRLLPTPKWARTSSSVANSNASPTGVVRVG